MLLRRGTILFFFQDHLPNSRVPLGKKPPILTRIERFWTVIQVRIHRGLLSDAQSLAYYANKTQILDILYVLSISFSKDGNRYIHFDSVKMIDS